MGEAEAEPDTRLAACHRNRARPCLCRRSGRTRIQISDLSGVPIASWSTRRCAATPTRSNPWPMAGSSRRRPRRDDQSGATLRIWRRDGTLERSLDAALPGENAALGHDIAIGPTAWPIWPMSTAPVVKLDLSANGVNDGNESRDPGAFAQSTSGRVDSPPSWSMPRSCRQPSDPPTSAMPPTSSCAALKAFSMWSVRRHRRVSRRGVTSVCGTRPRASSTTARSRPIAPPQADELAESAVYRTM